MSQSNIKEKTILVTGATGYVGARLIPKLLLAGYKVRATARSKKKLQGRSWANHENLEIVSADIFDQKSITKAAQGCSSAYYLIHSMNAEHKDFAEADKIAAHNMVAAAEQAGLKRIIYLGGLGNNTQDLSKHLRSRIEVAKILSSGKVPVTVLRAAMIIGSGSASFEILRYLVDRLPFMITPKWVRTPTQPIAISNVLEYLTACLENDQTIGRVFDIGGTEVLSYQALMDLYAELAGLGPRIVIPVPFFTPRLSSYWIHLVTPLSAYIARPLTEGLRNIAICMENSIQSIIPLKLLDCQTAIKLAIEHIQHQNVESYWADAGVMLPDEWWHEGDPSWAGGTIYVDKRQVVVAASPDEIWQVLLKIGGKTGWYYGTWLWKLRGFIDKLFGGVGLGRGRRNAIDLQVGDVLDFWRVSSVEPRHKLVLIAEMKLPGQAMLEFRICSLASGQTEITQIARFLPNGLSGILYWKIVTPFHNLVFNGMLKGIAQATNKPIIARPK